MKRFDESIAEHERQHGSTPQVKEHALGTDFWATRIVTTRPWSNPLAIPSICLTFGRHTICAGLVYEAKGQLPES
jgi:hypothetical protein